MRWPRWTLNALLLLGILCAGVMPSHQGDHGNARITAFSSINSIRLNSFEVAMIQGVNNARAAAGRPALTVTPGMTDLARSWALVQATADTMKHNPNLRSDLTAHGAAGWTFGAENVGVGPSNDPSLLFKAFMDSPGHKANILDARDRILGIGAVEVNTAKGLSTYVTMDFTDHYSSSYGGTRVAATGLKRDAWSPSSAHQITPMRNNDQRIDASRTGGLLTGVITSTHLLDGFASVLAVSDNGSDGSARLRFHDALSLRAGQRLNVTLVGRSRTGKAVRVTVQLLNPANKKSSSKVTVDLGSSAKTVSIPMPSGWSVPVTEVAIELPRSSLLALGPTRYDRYARIELAKVAV